MLVFHDYTTVLKNDKFESIRDCEHHQTVFTRSQLSHEVIFLVLILIKDPALFRSSAYLMASGGQVFYCDPPAWVCLRLLS